MWTIMLTRLRNATLHINAFPCILSKICKVNTNHMKDDDTEIKLRCEAHIIVKLILCYQTWLFLLVFTVVVSRTEHSSTFRVCTNRTNWWVQTLYENRLQVVQVTTAKKHKYRTKCCNKYVNWCKRSEALLWTIVSIT